VTRQHETERAGRPLERQKVSRMTERPREPERQGASIESPRVAAKTKQNKKEI
jgi:hypothetical protein